jgi:hypothetical protein|nr:hypothetical protein [Neorhizobium tomejilense]
MTPASEIAVRWYFDQHEAEETFTEDLVNTLYEGCEKGEQDSVDLLDRILLTASDEAKDSQWEPILNIAITLHRELTGVNKAIHNLEQVSLISDAVTNMPSNPLAKRITIMKIKECIDKLKP